MTRSARRRLPLAVVDQAASSASNLLLSIFVARAATPEEFGAFGTGYLVLLMALGLVRAALGDASVVASRIEGAQVLAPLRLYLAVAVAATAIAGGLAAWTDSIELAVLAGAMPLLLGVDAVRHWQIATRRLTSALWVDLTWLALGLVAHVALDAIDAAAWTHVVAWTGAGLAGAAAALARPGSARPPRGASAAWVGRHRRVVGSLGIEFVLSRGSVQLATVAVATIVGFSAFASLRALNVAFGPVTTLLVGTQSFGLAEFALMRPERARSRALVVASAGTLLTLAFAAGLWFLPPSVGAALFGASWDPRSPLLPVLGLQRAAAAWMTVTAVALRSMGRTELVARRRSAGVVVGAAASVPVAAVAGLQASVWTLTAGTLVAVALLTHPLVARPAALHGARDVTTP